MKFAELMAEARASGKRPPFLGRRFDAGGQALREPGCTIIGHIRDEAGQAALAAARARIEDSAAGRCWAWLPPSSWHMTMFDLLLHANGEKPEFRADWQEGLRGREADLVMVERFRGMDPGTPPPYRMRVTGLWRRPEAMGVRLEGESEAEDARIRAMRDRFADVAGLRQRPGHDTYGFHITLAYMIDWPDAAEAEEAERAIDEAEAELIKTHPVFELGAPEVCLFDDMEEFRPQFFLSP